jgi:hypothetical protein
MVEYQGDYLRRGTPTRLTVWDVRDDDDYGLPTRRMLVVAHTPEEAEAMWDDPFTEHRAFARPLNLNGRPLRLPLVARVLYSRQIRPARADVAA